MQGSGKTDRQTISQELSLDVEPHWESENVVLYCGDAVQLLSRMPNATVNGVITDPPYNSGGATTSERQRDPADKYCHDGNTCGRPSFGGDVRDQRSFKYWCVVWLTLCRELTVESGYLMVFIDWRQLPTMTDAIQAAGWTWRGIVPWNKGRGARAPHKGFFRHQCEYVVWATNGKVPKLSHAGPFDGCITEHVRRKDKHHITGKPTDLMRELVQPVEPGGIIIDPFAGSATTGIACSIEGRRFVGIEQSPEYCNIGAERLASATVDAA